MKKSQPEPASSAPGISRLFFAICLASSLLVFSSPGNALAAYCTSSSTNASYEHINEVSLNGSTNTSGPATYSDFTGSVLTVLNQGQTYSLYSVSMVVTSGGPWLEYVKTWIDYNHNEIFEANEEIDLGSQVVYDTATFSQTFTIPLNAVAGDTRMRVILEYNTEPNACGTYTWGETEDYTINIAQTTPYYCNDLDGDNHYDPTPSGACVGEECWPEGCVIEYADDCDDSDPNNFPGNTESCDNQDNNCDLGIDENLSRPTNCGIGECSSTGTETCTAGTWDGDSCISGAPAAETCDSLDNDCDGQTDDGLTGPANPNQIGVCSGSTQTQAIGPEEDLVLWHRGVNGWEDITESIDTANNVICGYATSFSPFGVGEPSSYSGIHIVPYPSALASEDTDRIVNFDASRSSCWEEAYDHMGIMYSVELTCSFTWDFGGPGTVVGGNGDDVIVYLYDSVGIYTATVEVTETVTGLSVTDTVEAHAVYVEPPPLSADFLTVVAGKTMTISATQLAADVQRAYIYWGDRKRTLLTDPHTSLGNGLIHSYSIGGRSYNIRVMTIDSAWNVLQYEFSFDPDLRVTLP